MLRAIRFRQLIIFFAAMGHGGRASDIPKGNRGKERIPAGDEILPAP
jgi:hypothetical protein